mmetsp:Transcript_17414/g.41014  ORF Transcript_17414/g.41014 Transcript_17414/m.41014 type:complete len:355 (+) Transcript_17414:386-1450(+)
MRRRKLVHGRSPQVSAVRLLHFAFFGLKFSASLVLALACCLLGEGARALEGASLEGFNGRCEVLFAPNGLGIGPKVTRVFALVWSEMPGRHLDWLCRRFHFLLILLPSVSFGILGHVWAACRHRRFLICTDRVLAAAGQRSFLLFWLGVLDIRLPYGMVWLCGGSLGVLSCVRVEAIGGSRAKILLRLCRKAVARIVLEGVPVLGLLIASWLLLLGLCADIVRMRRFYFCVIGSLVAVEGGVSILVVVLAGWILVVRRVMLVLALARPYTLLIVWVHAILGSIGILLVASLVGLHTEAFPGVVVEAIILAVRTCILVSSIPVLALLRVHVVFELIVLIISLILRISRAHGCCCC